MIVGLEASRTQVEQPEGTEPPFLPHFDVLLNSFQWISSQLFFEMTTPIHNCGIHVALIQASHEPFSEPIKSERLHITGGKSVEFPLARSQKKNEKEYRAYGGVDHFHASRWREKGTERRDRRKKLPANWTAVIFFHTTKYDNAYKALGRKRTQAAPLRFKNGSGGQYSPTLRKASTFEDHEGAENSRISIRNRADGETTVPQQTTRPFSPVPRRRVDELFCAGMVVNTEEQEFTKMHWIQGLAAFIALCIGDGVSSKGLDNDFTHNSMRTERGSLRCLIEYATSYRATDNYLETLNMASAQDCSILCLDIEDCHGFNYNTDIQFCELLGGNEPTKLSPQNGWDFYWVRSKLMAKEQESTPQKKNFLHNPLGSTKLRLGSVTKQPL
ncbi:unnamed protein product [Cyprideis torosa]|uniref:Uncharacterized protein n=1 Tax=Cyprideis torosa TaxID=163714 RepID=A0A7R8W6Y3_9CRUS|nr:unnamed protein product [Cyprideis torosa]CAG0884544.1 unnamed protein product [Cyprideis torosa]